MGKGLQGLKDLFSSSKNEMSVGYGKNKLIDPKVKAYGDKVYYSNNKNAYKSVNKVDGQISKTKSVEKKQFLNTVSDYLQKYFK